MSDEKRIEILKGVVLAPPDWVVGGEWEERHEGDNHEDQPEPELNVVEEVGGELGAAVVSATLVKMIHWVSGAESDQVALLILSTPHQNIVNKN